MSDNLQAKIQDTFGVSEEEILEGQLENISDWFGLDEGMIDLSPKVLELPKKWKYLTYLIAAKFAAYGGMRSEESVPHKEADEYFGWDREDGQTAKDYSINLSTYLTKTDGGSGRKIPPAKLEKAIDKIKDELGDQE